MKISEVCAKTGLTKRTVRFYVEKGLLSPETEYRNGKDHRDFSEEDVRMLKAISVLRSLDISVDDIGSLIGKEVTSGQLIEKYRCGSRNDLLGKERIYNILKEIKVNEAADIYSLAEAVQKLDSDSRIPPHDAEPDFSALEDLTTDEKQQAFERFHNELVRKNAVSDYKSKMLKRLLILFSAAAGVFLMICGLSWIPISVDITAKGYTYNDKTGKRYEDTLTVKGKIYKPLFFMSTFSGEVSLENTSEMNYIVSKECLLWFNDDARSQTTDEPHIRVYPEDESFSIETGDYDLYITDPERPNTTMVIEGFAQGEKMTCICKSWEDNGSLIYDYVFEEN